MREDYNRYTFAPGCSYGLYDDKEMLLVLYYQPNPDYDGYTGVMPGTTSRYNIPDIHYQYVIKNYLVNRFSNTLLVYSTDSGEEEINSILKAYKCQYGRDLEVVDVSITAVPA